MKKDFKISGFSLAEALITLLIVCMIVIASIPILTRKHRTYSNLPHGSYACYWNGDELVAKYMENKQIKDGNIVFDEKEGRYGCEFDPPKGARNFVVTILGGGGGGAGSAVGSSITKYEKNSYIGSTEAGIYEFLFVGAGGKGGKIEYEGEDKYTPQIRALRGTAGDIVYVPPTVIPKTSFYIHPAESEGSSSSMSFGSTLNNLNIKFETQAVGGTGGGHLSHHYNLVSDNNFIDSKYENFIILYYASNYVQGFYDCRRETDTSEVLDSNTIYAYKRFLSKDACPVNDVKNYNGNIRGRESFSNIKNVVFHDLSKSLKGPLISVYHQNDKRYNNNEELSRYNDTFGIEFNKKIKGPNSAYFKTASGHRDIDKEAKACSGEDWETKNYCVDYENNYGAGGGGQGFYGDAHYSEAVSGKSGVIIVKQSKMYAGLGGESGNTSQTTYQMLSNKIIMFPGKGGKGGGYSSNLIKTNSGYPESAKTAGASGESSYIKNSSVVLGGKGASAIYPDNESSFSSFTNENNSMPIGGNGKLAVEQKEGLTGGLGGFNGINNSINGQTESVFKNNAPLGTLGTITGAGSGGGGGSLIISKKGDYYSVDKGNGGQGASGLIFVQW